MKLTEKLLKEQIEKVMKEPLSLSSNDIRKMIQEEIANIKKENNG